MPKQEYKKLALHNSVCNEVFYQLQDCEAEHPFARFIGKCTDFNLKLDKCIRDNRKRMREQSFKESEERKRRFRAGETSANK